MSGRKPQVNYWKSGGRYFVCFRGKQHLLESGPDDSPNGPTYLKALAAFGQLMSLNNVEKDGNGTTFQALVENLLLHAKARLAPAAYRLREDYLGKFLLDFGTRTVRQVTPFQVESWIAQMRHGFSGTAGRRDGETELPERWSSRYSPARLIGAEDLLRP
jgi:hypothetical protein